MKRIIYTPTLIIICLVFSFRFAHAQHAYIPIPEDSAFWISVEEYWHEDDPSWQGAHTFNYLVWYTDGQDTIINGKRYFCY